MQICTFKLKTKIVGNYELAKESRCFFDLQYDLYLLTTVAL